MKLREHIHLALRGYKMFLTYPKPMMLSYLFRCVTILLPAHAGVILSSLRFYL